MIVEQRDYHVFTGKLNEVVRCTRPKGIELQQQHLGSLLGVVHDRRRRALDVHVDVGVRQLRRARAAPARASRPTSSWQDFLARLQPLLHTQQNRILDPHLVLADPVMDGKVAIVTGGAQGIGRAIADELARSGARIVIADLHGARGGGGGVPDGVGITADVANEADVQRLVDEVVERCGTIDVLVNNAGLYASLEMRSFEQIPLDEWRRVMDVNVASMFLMCRAVVPVMRKSGGGKIVNISSGTPFRGVPFLLHYVTSKGAIVALTRALAKELGKDNVLVNCVAPGSRCRPASRRIPRSSRSCATSPCRRARSSATRCPTTSSARSRSSAGRAPTSSPARRS